MQQLFVSTKFVNINVHAHILDNKHPLHVPVTSGHQ